VDPRAIHGAFHTDTLQPAIATHPRQQPAIARRRHWEPRNTEHTTDAVDNGNHMLIQMRVDTTRHRTRRTKNGHVIPFLC
jgi:hypothetical protein